MSSLRSRTRAREDRSAAPSPSPSRGRSLTDRPSQNDVHVPTSFIVKNLLDEVKVSETPVRQVLSTSTYAEELAQFIQEATILRIIKYPGAWVEPQVTTMVVIGDSQNNLLSFDDNHHLKLGEYPRNSNGIVSCVIIIIARKTTTAL